MGVPSLHDLAVDGTLNKTNQLPGFTFVIVVLDDEMEAMSLSSLCVLRRKENDSNISLSFSYRSRCRREILNSLLYPGPGFLSGGTWPSKPKSGLINQSINKVVI